MRECLINRIQDSIRIQLKKRLNLQLIAALNNCVQLTTSDSELLFSYLFYCGFLTLKDDFEKILQAEDMLAYEEVIFPNNETRSTFFEFLVDYYTASYGFSLAQLEEVAIQITNLLADNKCEMEKFETAFKQLIDPIQLSDTGLKECKPILYTLNHE